MLMNGNFRIAAPFINKRQVSGLKNAGADELYCGYVDEEWERRWPSEFHTVNRRGRGASFSNTADFREAVLEAENLDMPVFVTMNGLYTEEQYPWLFNTIDMLSRYRAVSGIILADMGLMLALKKRKYPKKIHISTGAAVFNHNAVDFFSCMGADRVILDRQLDTDELREIISRRRSLTEIEIFVFYTACLFIDGYCSFLHCLDNARPDPLDKKGMICHSYDAGPFHKGCDIIKYAYSSSGFRAHKLQRGFRAEGLKYAEDRYPFGCNLCALFALKDSLPITLKVVERRPERVKCVRNVIRCIRAINSGMEEGAYKKMARQTFKKITGRDCNGDQCYFPQGLC
ncbi:MAG: U32 family peptidase [Candidatus Omnitrophica bacterium]|nr:U32 family peptidase [Candidatus Omnitrophota bacterium]